MFNHKIIIKAKCKVYTKNNNNSNNNNYSNNNNNNNKHLQNKDLLIEILISI